MGDIVDKSNVESMQTKISKAPSSTKVKQVAPEKRATRKKVLKVVVDESDDESMETDVSKSTTSAKSKQKVSQKKTTRKVTTEVVDNSDGESVQTGASKSKSIHMTMSTKKICKEKGNNKE